MAELITSVGTVLTGVTTWAGSMLTFVVGQPLLLIPAVFGLIGATTVFIKRVKQ